MSIIAEKFKEALNTDNVGIFSYMWKGPKERNKEQVEKRLVDATEEELSSWYKHCHSMLYSKDRQTPGRYTLLDIIKEQRLSCNAELYLRYIESSPTNPMARHIYLANLKEFLNSHLEEIPQESWDKISICSIIPDTPMEFANITIRTVIKACLNNLGLFNKKPLTLTFISKLGLCPTKEEIDEYLNDREQHDKLELVRKNLGINSNVKLFMNRKGGLTYSEFRAMFNLRNNVRYSDMTSIQLSTLRNKVLFAFEDEVVYKSKIWKEKMQEIEEVAAYKKYNVDKITKLNKVDKN